jgi:iron complex transport system substrate-binding protein
VTQALCAVCAVSVDDVRALAEQMPSPPEVVSLDATTLGEVLADIRTLGRHVGAPEAAEALIADAAERIDRVQAAVADAPLVTVAALEWLAPVYAAGHWTPQLVEYAGGIDVLGLAGERSAQVSWVDVAAAQPSVIVVMPCGYDAERAQEEAYTYGDELAEVGADRIVAVDASAYFSRPGPRLVDGLELLARILHPQETLDLPAAGRPVPVLLQ